MQRYAIEHGLTSRDIGERVGVHPVTVRRHFLGWPISATTSRLYRTFYPEMPIPARGRPEFFENPLPVRRLPISPWSRATLRDQRNGQGPGADQP
jgi:hypothetical protein